MMLSFLLLTRIVATMKMKSFVLSRLEKRLRANGEFMRTRTKQQSKEITALKRMKDEEIDLSDLHEVKDWSRAVVGKFYRPIKEPVTVRLDADVLAWLRSQGAGYQTRINALLRRAMERDARR